MPTIAQPAQNIRPFAVIGFSVADEILCPTCLPRTTPITGEKLTHTCRLGPRPVPEHVRRQILFLDEKRFRPGRIAAQLGITIATVMRVLSGDDADAASCPACEASMRTENREVLPLYYADSTVQEEVCTYCGHALADLALQRATERTAEHHVEHTTHGAQAHPALKFDRPPPQHVLQALKNAGWRWRAQERIWVDYSRNAGVPASVRIAPTPAPVIARPPQIRRRTGEKVATDC